MDVMLKVHCCQPDHPKVKSGCRGGVPSPCTHSFIHSHTERSLGFTVHVRHIQAQRIQRIRNISADDQTHPPAVVFSLPPTASLEARGVQHLFALAVILLRVWHVGRTRWSACDLKHIEPFGEQTLVENQGC